MGHSEEHNRCILIGGCAASAQAALDAAAVELERAGDHAGLSMVARARQPLGELARAYPCDRGRGESGT